MTDSQGEIFRRFIESNGWSDTKVANMLGVSSQQVANYYSTSKFRRDTLQKIHDTFPDFILKNIETRGSVRMLTNIKHGVPYYDTEITASIVRSFSDVKERPAFLVDFPPFNDCDGWLPIVGDSMFPRFQAGEMVAIKQIFNMESILWGEPHLVITNEEHDNMRTIKTIHEHSDPAKMILRASNPQFKGDTIIYKKNILSLYIVKGQAKKSQY